MGCERMYNSSLLREMNTNKILLLLLEHKHISRADISKATNLAMPTVLRIVESLIHQGIVVEVGKGKTTMGRKPILLKINKSYGYFIGVSIGTKLVGLLTDFKGNILDEKVLTTDFSKGPEHIVLTIKHMVEHLITNNHIDRKKIKTISIARPGTGFKSGILIADSAFFGWDKIDFVDLFKSHLSEFAVEANNITVCGALGEQWFGELKHYQNGLFVFVDTGVGSAAIIDGKIYKGGNDCAGELGHQVIKFDGETCYCGNKGCLEMYTSSAGIVKRVRERIRQGEYSMLGPEDVFDFGCVVQKHLAGDALCGEVLRYSGKLMGVGLANAINLYNPEKIVFGGEVSHLSQCYIDEAIYWAQQYTFNRKAAQVEFAVSKIVQYPEALGAVALALSKTFNADSLLG